MRTTDQIEADRRNGRLSGAPVAAQDKNVASQNAIEPGGLANVACLHGESRPTFDALLAQHLEWFQPQGPVEEACVQQVAAAKWRAMRYLGFEASIIDAAAERMSESVVKEFGGVSNNMRNALAFSHLADHSSSLRLLDRYESRSVSTWRTALKRLEQLQSARKNQKWPNEPGELVDSTRERPE